MCILAMLTVLLTWGQPSNRGATTILLDDSTPRVTATAFGGACGTGQGSSISDKGDEADLTSNVLIKACYCLFLTGSGTLPNQQYV